MLPSPASILIQADSHSTRVAETGIPHFRKVQSGKIKTRRPYRHFPLFVKAATKHSLAPSLCREYAPRF